MRGNARLFWALLLSLLVTALPACSEDPAPDQGVRPAGEVEEALTGGLQRGLTGVSFAFQRAGHPSVSVAVGLANREKATPLAPADRFRAYSVMKTFTAVLTLQLVDDGLLALDDPVTKWLKDPTVGRIPHANDITVRQLLTHTSGVYDYYNGPGSSFVNDAITGPSADWSKNWSPTELLTYVDGANHAADFAPGQGVKYSNTGYILLGLIVEAASGKRFAEQMHARILSPLGLTNTFFAADTSSPSETVQGYHRLYEDLTNVSAINLSWAWTQGGLVSTAEDLARFTDALFGGSLIKPASLEAMLTFQPADEQGREWGMGVARLQTAEGELIGMNGSGPGFVARMYRLPEGSTAVLLTNTNLEDNTVDVVFAQAVASELARVG